MNMEIKKEQIANIKTIVEASRKNKLVVFAGAGVSKDSGVPTWNELIEKFKDELSLPKEENDYLRIAQMYFDRYQFKKYIEKVRNTLEYKKLSPNKIHEIIFKLSPLHIVTTNYDDLFEKVKNKEGYSYSLVRRDSEFPYALNNKYILKIHGDLDIPETIVLKEDDYINYSLEHPLLENFVKSLFASNVVLFVGYSFSDINLKYILNNVKSILGNDFQKAYLLNTGDKQNENVRYYMNSRGIDVIEYGDFDFEDKNADGKIYRLNFIEEYLKGRNVLSKKAMDFSKGQKLGDKTFNFLLFLTQYEPFYESIKDNHIIEQLYKSLNRFSEFNSLPPSFISNLYPFNTTGKFYNSYDANSISTNNEILRDFFINEVEFDGEISTFKAKAELSQEKQEQLSQLFKEILKLLNYSQIWHFGYNDKKANSIIQDKFIPLRAEKQPTKCNCFNCLFWNFRFDDLVRAINDYNISDSDDLKTDMKYAFALTRVGMFIKARETYKQIASKAWNRNNQIIHLFAKRNERYLRNMIWRDEDRFNSKSEESKTSKSVEEIEEELREIDFLKIIANLSDLDKDQHELILKTIYREIVVDSKDTILKLSEEIEDVKKRYDRGGYRFGPNEYFSLLIEQIKLHNFYYHNCLIEDIYREYINAANTSFKALLTSYATKKNYRGKLKHFERFFFTSFILYGKTKEFKDKLGELKIESIPIEKNELPEILSSINNFFGSVYTYNSFSKENYKDEIFAAVAKRHFFSDKLDEYFRNVMLLMKYVEIEKDEAEKLLKNLIPFLKNQEFLNWESYDYLAEFLYAKKQFITAELIELLLEVAYRNRKFIGRTKIFESIYHVCKEQKIVAIKSSSLLNEIVVSFSNSKETKYRESVVYLSIIADTKTKKLIKDTISKWLNEEFNINILIVGTNVGLISMGDYFPQYIDYVSRHLHRQRHPFSSDADDETEDVSYDFMSFMFNLIHHKADFSKLPLDRLKKLLPYQSFYLYPDKFDMKKFDPRWLKYNDWYPEVLFNYLKNSKNGTKISLSLKTYLKKNDDEKLSVIHSKYFS